MQQLRNTEKVELNETQGHLLWENISLCKNYKRMKELLVCYQQRVKELMNTDEPKVFFETISLRYRYPPPQVEVYGLSHGSPRDIAELERHNSELRMFNENMSRDLVKLEKKFNDFFSQKPGKNQTLRFWLPKEETNKLLSQETNSWEVERDNFKDEISVFTYEKYETEDRVRKLQKTQDSNDNLIEQLENAQNALSFNKIITKDLNEKVRLLKKRLQGKSAHSSVCKSFVKFFSGRKNKTTHVYKENLSKDLKHETKHNFCIGRSNQKTTQTQRSLQDQEETIKILLQEKENLQEELSVLTRHKRVAEDRANDLQKQLKKSQDIQKSDKIHIEELRDEADALHERVRMLEERLQSVSNEPSQPKRLIRFCGPGWMRRQNKTPEPLEQARETKTKLSVPLKQAREETSQFFHRNYNLPLHVGINNLSQSRPSFLEELKRDKSELPVFIENITADLVKIFNTYFSEKPCDNECQILRVWFDMVETIKLHLQEKNPGKALQEQISVLTRQTREAEEKAKDLKEQLEEARSIQSSDKILKMQLQEELDSLRSRLRTLEERLQTVSTQPSMSRKVVRFCSP